MNKIDKKHNNTQRNFPNQGNRRRYSFFIKKTVHILVLIIS